MKLLIKLLLISFFLRIFLAFLPSFGIDMSGWIAWGERLVALGPVNFYSGQVWTNYLPGYLYILWFLGWIRTLTQILPDSAIYQVILKLPAILADLGTAVLIFKILEKRVSSKIALAAVAIYLFNPALIFNTAVWGQIDSVLTFFLLASTYFLIESEKPILASFAIALSFLIKPQTIALLPIFGFYLYQKFGFKNLLKSATASLILIFGLSLPFFTTNPILGIPAMFLRMSADYPYTSLFAFNFWWLAGGWKPDSAVNFLVSDQAWGVILWIVSQIIILFWLAKNRRKEDFYLAATFSLLAFFVLPTRVHERYLFPFFPYGLIAAAIFGSFFWLIYGILTLIHFSNLYFVYTYYNPNFLKIEVVSQLISKLSVSFAALTVFIFSFLIGYLFKIKWSKT